MTAEEFQRYLALKAEAGNPENITDRLAILDCAKAHVAKQALADRERGKTAEEHRRELFG